tara:strand:+ start:438 stop:656 length:219 start_codon:yes stop_codon:yes gene_type:complete
MKHWVTEEEMGSGFRYSKRKHEYFDYNSLDKVSKHELNIMRTKYLIRDWWSLDKLKELKDFLDGEIAERFEE